jgi:hypothetical protein
MSTLYLLDSVRMYKCVFVVRVRCIRTLLLRSYERTMRAHIYACSIHASINVDMSISQPKLHMHLYIVADDDSVQGEAIVSVACVSDMMLSCLLVPGS